MTHRSHGYLALAAAAVLATSPAVAQDQCFSLGLDLQYGDIDMGWKGTGFDQPGLSGSAAALAVVSRCSVGATVCADNADCSAGTCEPTCAPGGPSSSCELAGPIGPRRCLLTLDVCSTNADCASPETCEHFMAPPLPLSVDGTPACVTMFVTDDITGTLDLVTGESEIAMPPQRWRVHLGVAASTPCPTCGTIEDDPQVGFVFACGAGSSNTGAACSVDALNPRFGGSSYDCPPSSISNVSGPGLAIAFGTITTGTRVEQAVLPCGFPLDQSHPVVGQGACIDDFSACSTNADCLRCTDSLSACMTDADCGIDATCMQAPAQPIACGIYCHCGLCGGTDSDRPCLSDSDCDAGVQCLPGAGGAAQQAQPRNNDCNNLICGEDAPEQCCTGSSCVNEGILGSTPPLGACSNAAFRRCVSNADCASTGSGECEFRPKPCFEGLITRTGQASPLTARCRAEPREPECATNGDCTVGACSQACPRPVYSALGCVSASFSPAVNSALGLPGPIAIAFNGLSTAPPTVPPGDCSATPRSGCRSGGRSAVAIKNRANPDRNKLVWKWLEGEATDQADYADPRAAADYGLCIYDSVDDTPSLSAVLSIAHGSSWTDKTPRGYAYKDSAALAGGVRLVRLRTGVDAKARIVFKGRGRGLSLPAPVGTFRYFDQSPTVTIQMVASNGRCWTTEFDVAGTRRNSARRFAASVIPE